MNTDEVTNLLHGLASSASQVDFLLPIVTWMTDDIEVTESQLRRVEVRQERESESKELQVFPW